MTSKQVIWEALSKKKLIYPMMAIAGSMMMLVVYGHARVYGNAKINKKSKVRLVPKKCAVYERDNVVNTTDKTE